MTFKQYPKYRDSGVEWLGEVPEGWKVSRLGFESWMRARLGWKGLKAEEYVDDGFVFLSTPNIKGRDIDFENVNYIDEIRYDESPEIKLNVGDVLLAKDGSTLGTVNVVRELPRPATVNSSIAVISPMQRLDSFYLYRLFESSYLANTIKRIKGGMGVPHLFQEDLNKFYITLPPLREQTAISAFLDRETARIDALVEKKTRFIGLLKEKRSALITDAVTGKFDVTTGKPYPKYKPSGVEWLGDVPAGWGVKQLKFAAPLQSGKLAAKGLDLPYIGLENIESWTGKFVPNAEADETEGVSNTFSDGDVLFGKLRPYLAKALLPDFDGLCSSELLVLRGKEMLPAYLLRFVLSYDFVNQVDASTYGTKMPRANWEFIGNLPAIVPPKNEQFAIATFLDRETARIDALLEKTGKSIELLKERRVALITAAVTGKIDVREMV